MASFVLNGGSTTARVLTNGQDGLIGQNGSLAVLGSPAISSSGGTDVFVHGSVMSNVNAISALTGATSLTLFVGHTGTISSSSRGVSVFVSGSTEIYNAGTIFGQQEGMRLHGSDTSYFHNIVNSGTIMGNYSGVILFTRGGRSEFINTGTISSDGEGVFVSQSDGGSFELWNSGTISGAGLSYRGYQDGVDIVNNTGVMLGDVELAAGDDIFDGRGGTVVGEVRGDEGNDTYIIDDSDIELVEADSEGVDEVRSSADFALGENFENLTLIGAQSINGTGNGKINTILGNAGDNRVAGGAGNDILRGNGGDDRIFGGEGADQISSGNGNDSSWAGRGNDEVFGGNGDDRLRGGAGNDRIFGGQGDDLMTGGPGRDVFVFKDDFGVDVVSDFNAFNNNEDIHLRSVSAITNFADLLADHMRQAGNNVLIEAGGGNTITLRGVDIGDLNPGDFIF